VVGRLLGVHGLVGRHARAVVLSISLANVHHQLARGLSDLLRLVTLLSVSSIFEVGAADQPDVTSLTALISFRTASTALRGKSVLIRPSLIIIFCDNDASVLLVVTWEHSVTHHPWLLRYRTPILLVGDSVSTRIYLHNRVGSPSALVFALPDLLYFVCLINGCNILVRLAHGHDTVSPGVLGLA